MHTMLFEIIKSWILVGLVHQAYNRYGLQTIYDYIFSSIMFMGRYFWTLCADRDTQVEHIGDVRNVHEDVKSSRKHKYEHATLIIKQRIDAKTSIYAQTKFGDISRPRAIVKRDKRVV